MKLVIILLLMCGTAEAGWQTWTATAYCPEKCCCGKFADGITASGKDVREGMVAVNHLPFHTRLEIKGMGVYVVEDRGAKRIFGMQKKPRRRLDIFMRNHSDCVKFGKQRIKVRILHKQRKEKT